MSPLIVVPPYPQGSRFEQTWIFTTLRCFYTNKLFWSYVFEKKKSILYICGKISSPSMAQHYADGHDLNKLKKNAIWGNFKTSFSFSGHIFFYEDVYTIWFLIIPNYFYLKGLVFILQTWISFTYRCILRSLVEIGYVERKRIGALLIVFQLINDFLFIVLLTYLALKPYLCKCIDHELYLVICI